MAIDLRSAPCARSVIPSFVSNEPPQLDPAVATRPAQPSPRPGDPTTGPPPLRQPSERRAPTTPPSETERASPKRQGAAADPRRWTTTPNQLVSERGGRGGAAASRAAEEPEDPAPDCAVGARVTLRFRILWLRAIRRPRPELRSTTRVLCVLCAARACVCSFRPAAGGFLGLWTTPS